MANRKPVTKVTPETVRYRGDHVVLIRKILNGFGPGAVVCFDLDGDGTFEHQVCADDAGFYTFCFEAEHSVSGGASALFIHSADGKKKSPVIPVYTIQEDPCNPATEIPVNKVPGERFDPEPEICTCTDCPPGNTLTGASLDAYTHSYTPTAYGVELATGKQRQSFAITSFDTRMLGFDFAWHHSSLIHYDGPWGLGGSHSFNMMIVQTGKLTGKVVTPDLRIFDIGSKDGVAWFLPVGFYSTLRLDPKCRRWTMTHFSGLEVEFFQGALHRPGYPMSIRDPNHNTTCLEYDASGLLQRIVTDLGQVQALAYDARSRLHTFTDHLHRAWSMRYDDRNRLTRIVTPITAFADIAAGQEITDRDLPYVLVNQPRTTKLAYMDERFPGHITAVTDQRGATPEARTYDAHGRVKTAILNGKPVQYAYEVEVPLKKLEPANLVTRVVDREGNVNDHEIHGPDGGPVDGLGRFGLRRMVTWTERGKGNAPLRDDEPTYWEQRWLHDCECLAPAVVVQPFSSDDAAGLAFDALGIPTNWPRTIYTYNQFRQVTCDLYTDGAASIRTEAAYQDGAFGGHGQFSRRVRWTDPRAFDDNPLYAGLRFERSYEYDTRGNRTRHDAPTVTRGVVAPQVITESWTYNAFGQALRHVDANGNVTVNTYYEGPSTGGDINTKGTFGGHLKSITVGAQGSKDTATDLTTTFRVNSLGMTTQKVDPKGFAYDTEYDDLQERTRWIEPPVTLRNGAKVRYETRWFYDGAGNNVVECRSNFDFDGSVPANAWIARSSSYDDVNKMLSERVEVDADDANDLITRYAYDGNDDLAVTRKPEGNRMFRLYDERRRRYKTFHGVAPGLRIDDSYPSDKRAQDLGGTAFVGLTVETYDARLNHVRRRDGRGNVTNRLYDFYNRQVAESDPNGNGWVRAYDDASNVLTGERGAVAPDTRRLTQVLERTYARFDEIGRGYKQVLDNDLGTDERAQIDPAGDDNSSYVMVFDPGSRVVSMRDANGNTTAYGYDAADRELTTRDALGNVRASAYDANSNVVQVTTAEVPGPGERGSPESYATRHVYDELNRRVESHILGLNGNSIDHQTFFAFDSRSNYRLIQDAEGNVALKTFDDHDREVRVERFDADPASGAATQLLRYERAYDRNSRMIEERAFASVNDPGSVQATRYFYDNLDRLVRIVYPDARDPETGEQPGPDRPKDQVDVTHDENSNAILLSDQRGVVFRNAFDPGNRLTGQLIDLPPGVPGVTRQSFGYDALNRVVQARNDYTAVDLAYDALSRQTSETQSIRLDGNGFSNGWQYPVVVASRYDKQSNRTAYSVLDGSEADLETTTTYDALNRAGSIGAAYFDRPLHPIATYTYIGPVRMRSKTLGNGAKLTRAYDGKRRIQSHEWTGPCGVLVGFAYDYDRMDNALFERFTHDGGRSDFFAYNDRYEVVGASYQSASQEPPSNPGSILYYDDVFNRRQASFDDPLGVMPPTLDCYAANKANEYTQLLRNGQAFDPAYDEAGNMTRLPVRPASGPSAGRDVIAAARWDAFNCLFDIQAGANRQQHYRYDPFRRRVASLELSSPTIEAGSRRTIYDRWRVVEERLFGAGSSLSLAGSNLERVYVNGQAPDEPLLTAIDRDRDGRLGDNGKNEPGRETDQEYYFLCNRLGSVMGLLDADDPDRLLERYRYTVYGEPTVIAETGYNGAVSDSNGPDNGLGNPYFFTGRRLDDQSGLYYFRNRYYDPRSGRFLSRDLFRERHQANLYHYVRSNPINYMDPFGLYTWEGHLTFWEWDYTWDNRIVDYDLAISFDCGFFDPGYVPGKPADISGVVPLMVPLEHEGSDVNHTLLPTPVGSCCHRVAYAASVVWDPDYATAGGAIGSAGGAVVGGVIGALKGIPTGPGAVATGAAGVIAGAAAGAGVGYALGLLVGWFAGGKEAATAKHKGFFEICCCSQPTLPRWHTVLDPTTLAFTATDDDWYLRGYMDKSACGRAVVQQKVDETSW